MLQLHLCASKDLSSDPQQQYVARLHSGFRIVTAFSSSYLVTSAVTSIRSVSCACEYQNMREIIICKLYQMAVLILVYKNLCDACNIHSHHIRLF
jgi:hypothetical protein